MKIPLFYGRFEIKFYFIYVFLPRLLVYLDSLRTDVFVNVLVLNIEKGKFEAKQAQRVGLFFSKSKQKMKHWNSHGRESILTIK